MMSENFDLCLDRDHSRKHFKLCAGWYKSIEQRPLFLVYAHWLGFMKRLRFLFQRKLTFLLTPLHPASDEVSAE